jgi:muramoyltetrapeptide carboxypeptidase
MINRRDFGKLMAVGSVGAIATVAAAPAERGAKQRLIKPPRLREGDTIGMVAPASMAFEIDRIRLAKEQLEAIGFRVRLGEHVFERHGYLAGTDQQRADDVNRMFADAEVDGIVFYTGGWGSSRLLPLLDVDAIRRNPKVVLGFSDITALLNAIHQETGLVTFHGPVGASNLRPYTLENLRRIVMSTDPVGVLANPQKEASELVNRTYRIIRIREGTAAGPLVGGNLTLVTHLMGTPWEVPTDGAILFLEDVNEEHYRVDRMLTQLRLGGKLDRVAGVVFGYCTRCPVTGPAFSMEEILRDHLEPLGVPVMAGLAFGHIEKQLTFPVGLDATLDVAEGVLRIDEAAVV